MFGSASPDQACHSSSTDRRLCTPDSLRLQVRVFVRERSEDRCSRLSPHCQMARAEGRRQSVEGSAERRCGMTYRWTAVADRQFGSVEYAGESTRECNGRLVVVEVVADRRQHQVRAQYDESRGELIQETDSIRGFALPYDRAALGCGVAEHEDEIGEGAAPRQHRLQHQDPRDPCGEKAKTDEPLRSRCDAQPCICRRDVAESKRRQRDQGDVERISETMVFRRDER